MEKIKNLYDGINFTTIPKVILKQLNQNGIRKSSISKRGKDGKFTTTYGDLLRPIFVTFYYNELNFCINEKYIGHLFELLDFGLCFDINNKVLNRNNIEVFYNEYSKGFNKGYNEFENNLKNNSNLFSTSNEQISYKIYSRIIEHWTENKDGSIILNVNDIKINDKITFLLTESNFFESGVNGGEFYKAWEIILNNPTVFEPIFTKYSEVKTIQPQITEPEPLDFSVIPIIKFQNNFDRVLESTIFEYFKTKLVAKKYITEPILNDYLNLAFDKKTPPKQKFSFEKLNTQNDITQIFYNYYKTTAVKPYGRQIEYLNLLKNYFNGFENLNIKNFSK